MFLLYPISKDIHSGGALVAIALVLMVSTIGMIFELFAVLRTIKAMKLDSNLKNKKNSFFIFIGIAYLCAYFTYIGIIAYSFFAYQNS